MFVQLRELRSTCGNPGEVQGLFIRRGCEVRANQATAAVRSRVCPCHTLITAAFNVRSLAHICVLFTDGGVINTTRHKASDPMAFTGTSYISAVKYEIWVRLCLAHCIKFRKTPLHEHKSVIRDTAAHTDLLLCDRLFLAKSQGSFVRLYNNTTRLYEAVWLLVCLYSCFIVHV